jgi:hypothetical protein
MRYLLSTIAAIFIALATVPMGYADQEDPDTLQVNSVICYQSTLETGDVLCITQFAIRYTPMPDPLPLPINEAFVGRFFDSTGELSSVAPILYPQATISVTTSAPYLGYGAGVLSHYFSAFQVNQNNIVFGGTGYSVRLQGNPSVFATPPATTFTSIQWATPSNVSNALVGLVRTLAGVLQDDWTGNNVVMTELAASSALVLTNQGALYFSLAIPNLNQMAPNVFRSAIFAPTVEDDDGGIDLATTYESFWQGTAFADSIGSWNILYRTIAWFAVVCAVAWMVMAKTDRPGLGILGGLGAALPMGAVIGMAPLALVFIVGFGAVFFIGLIWLFLR